MNNNNLYNNAHRLSPISVENRVREGRVTQAGQSFLMVRIEMPEHSVFELHEPKTIKLYDCINERLRKDFDRASTKGVACCVNVLHF